MVEAYLADIQRTAERHDSVTLVATALLHLAEIAEGSTFVGHSDGHQVADELVAAIVVDHRCLGTVFNEGALVVVLIEGHSLVVHVHVIAQNTNRHHTQHIAQTPVRPVMAGALTTFGMTEVHPGVVTTTKEVDGGVIPHTNHPLLETAKVLTAPTVVVTHQFGGIGESIAIKTCSKGNVSVAGHSLCHIAPLHQDTDCGIGMSTVTADFPTEGVLESHGRTTSCIHIVVA